MKLRTVTEPPKDGTQFIASWISNNLPWSQTFKYISGKLYVATDDCGFNYSSFPVDVEIIYQIIEPKPLTTKEILIALGEGKTLFSEGGSKYVLEGEYLMDWQGNEHSISELLEDQPIIKAE